MAQNRKNLETKELLSALNSWIYKYDQSGNSMMNKLVDDIENGSDLKIWADLAPETYLPNPQSKNYINGIRRINSITGLRNVLVFSPVALTWAAISVVTTAFSKFEAENSNSVVNFLSFWQQGFGYLNDFWKLSNVAIFDAFLVSIVIGLTFVINFLTRSNLESNEKYELEVQDARIRLIFKLNEFFYQYKYPTPNQLNKNIYSATKSLDKTLKSLMKVVSRLEKDIAKYPNSAKIVGELNNLTKVVKKLPKK